ncbi:hypothetical protein I6A60_00475 [Frankia sp. AgB1.9]|uniref:hypothetical protein n=1 Tax=unclassified Frankia TaxID=2632575 RepID=UPI001932CEA3|nr:MULTISPECIES: hypothetical protein [unclassified Frankia]MBL7487355.1 hypothetical protein [Frankia sp. AgW1.1]MBL7546363.1 hypothetical protein [Frankia sp. AgB1.9]MBL7618592.1 hypothetical protein [Frankia sp. AgB1.8]
MTPEERERARATERADVRVLAAMIDELVNPAKAIADRFGEAQTRAELQQQRNDRAGMLAKADRYAAELAETNEGPFWAAKATALRDEIGRIDRAIGASTQPAGDAP